MLEYANRYDLRALRTLILGGEAIQAERLCGVFDEGTEIVNMYGSIECTDVATCYHANKFIKLR